MLIELAAAERYDSDHAVRALGELGPAASAALPTLRKLLASSNVELADAAFVAIRRIEPAAVAPPK